MATFDLTGKVAIVTGSTSGIGIGVARVLVGDLAAAGRVPDERQVGQVERLEEAGEVVGVGVHLVAVPRLAGATVPPPVVRDGAVAGKSGSTRTDPVK